MIGFTTNSGGLNRDTLMESIFLLSIIAWVLYVLNDARSFDAYFAWILPVVVAVPLLLILILQLASLHSATLSQILDRIRLDDTSNIEDANPISSTRDVIVFAVLAIGFIVSSQLIGFFLTMPLFLYTFFWAYDSFHWKTSVIVTVGLWVSISFVLGTVFAVPGVDFGPFSDFALELF